MVGSHRIAEVCAILLMCVMPRLQPVIRGKDVNRPASAMPCAVVLVDSATCDAVECDWPRPRFGRACSRGGLDCRAPQRAECVIKGALATRILQDDTRMVLISQGRLREQHPSSSLAAP